MMDQVECVYFKSVPRVSKNPEESGLSSLKFLSSIVFEICPKEPCLLVKDEADLVIYVDDIVVMSKTSLA